MEMLRNPNMSPPDGFRFQCEATGHEIRMRSLPELIAETETHLRSNDLPVPDDLRQQIEDQICKRIPDSEMYCQPLS